MEFHSLRDGFVKLENLEKWLKEELKKLEVDYKNRKVFDELTKGKGKLEMEGIGYVEDSQH